MSEIKQYDTEVRLEAVMGTNHYGVHIHAMTTEDLHSKSGIAVELAWRDLRIEQLIAQLEAAQKERDVFRLAFQQNEQAKQELFAQKDLLITANLNISRRAEKAEAELSAAKRRIDELEIHLKEERAANYVLRTALSAANEKLSKPVVLPPRRSASSFVDEEFSNKDLAAIYNAARVEFSVKITNAGFTVEGG
ncbi:TPA: hypothetical protein ACPZUG_004303 [Yersinia enterocolitica]